MAPIQNPTSRELEAGYPTATQEKDLLAGVETSAQESRPKPKNKMPSPRRLLLALFLCLVVSFGLASALSPRQLLGRPCHDANKASQVDLTEEDKSQFSKVISSVSPLTLHEILHKYFPDRYQHGVYASDHSAMEAIHEETPALAASVVAMVKRDAGISNSTTTTTTSTSVPATSSTTPVSTSTTTTESSSSSASSSSSSSTSSSESSTSSTSSKSTHSTSSSSEASSSSAIVFTSTSTNGNGGVTFVTATSYVAVAPPTTTSSTPTASGSLQTNAAVPMKHDRMLDLVVGAVIGGAMLV